MLHKTSLIADERYSYAYVNKKRKKENVTVCFYMDALYLELHYSHYQPS